jgi:transcriptional regulator with XRE-family HTH domain
MDAADVWAADGVITRAIGEEIRRVRRSIGWTRIHLADRMPTDIHIRTLAAYEQGARQVGLVRLVEICLTLGVAPSAVIGLALHRAEIDLQTVGMEVDLHAIVRDERPEFAALRTWARKRLHSAPDGIARLSHAVIAEMAVILGHDQPELIRMLSRFTPPAAPVRDAAPTNGSNP